MFGRLRSDAPHKINAEDEESALGLDASDRLIEKCHFIYKAKTDILVWQVNTDVGFVSRFEAYVSQLLNDSFAVLPITGSDALQRVLEGGAIKSFDVSVARPISMPARTPTWTQSTMDLLNHVDGATIKVTVSAGRDTLGAAAKRVIQQLRVAPSTRSLRVRMEEEDEPIDLFVDTISDRVVVEIYGHYPDSAELYSAIESAYTNKSELLRPYFR